MEKKFKDLKKGDSVFIIDGMGVVVAKVRETSHVFWNHHFYVYTTYTGWPYCGYPGSKRAGHMFTDEDEAYKQLWKGLERRKKKLEKRIDKLVTEFDLLNSITPPTVFPSTKIPSMKELKPGDSVWWICKEEKKVKEVKILELIENRKGRHCWLGYGSLIFSTSMRLFSAFPNSSHSISYDFHTGEEQAWKYMLKWKKSRMCTVGKEMEKLMKELEEIEKYEEIW